MRAGFAYFERARRAATSPSRFLAGIGGPCALSNDLKDTLLRNGTIEPS
jgi:hypothetical protein